MQTSRVICHTKESITVRVDEKSCKFFCLQIKTMSSLKNYYHYIIKGVVKASEPNILKEYGGYLDLTDNGERHLLKSMRWVQRKCTNEEIEPSGKL